MFITATKLYKSFDSVHVLSDVSFSIDAGARIGLVGKNGSGKSTLLQIIAGTVASDDGNVLLHKGTTVNYVPQIPTIADDCTVRDFLADYTDRPHRVDEVLQSLSFGDTGDKACGTLSGGQKTKIYLARIALYEADVLLLDEPTNYLDLAGLEWLQNYLRTYKGAILVVSHDRYFLDKTVNQIFEIENECLTVYGGNYSHYHEQKAIKTQAYVNEYESQQKELKRLKKSAVRQNYEGNRHNADRKNLRDNDKYSANYFADRASNKLHSAGKNIESRIGHIDMLEKPKKESVLDIYFKPSGARNSDVITVEDMSIGYGGEVDLFHIDSLRVTYGQRVAIQGDNGSGKTTLIKQILQHDAHDEITVGSGVRIGYLSQDHSQLVDNQTAIESLIKIEGIDQTQAYKILSQIEVSPAQAHQKLSDFSSGQKTKLLLARIMVSGANCIILDEPTNHLDFQSIDVIEQALRDFIGTLIVVSHDRYFLKEIGITRYLSIQDGRLAHVSVDHTQSPRQDD